MPRLETGRCPDTSNMAVVTSQVSLGEGKFCAHHSLDELVGARPSDLTRDVDDEWNPRRMFEIGLLRELVVVSQLEPTEHSTVCSQPDALPAEKAGEGSISLVAPQRDHRVVLEAILLERCENLPDLSVGVAYRRPVYMTCTPTKIMSCH